MIYSDVREFAESVLAQFGNVSNPVSAGLVKKEYKQSCLNRIQSELSLLKENHSSEDDGFRLTLKETAGCENELNQETINLLWTFGNLDSGDVKKITSATAIEALKCLANIQVLLPSMRLLFSEYQQLPKLVSCLKLANHSLGSSFLCLRLIFFATATKTSLGDEFVSNDLLNILSEIIEKCQFNIFKDEDWISCDAVILECIKVGFNVTVGSSPLAVSMFSTNKTLIELTQNDETSKKYNRFLTSIIYVFLDKKLHSPPLSSPHSHIINTMMNIPIIDPHLWFPKNDYTLLDILLKIFEDSFKEIAPEDEKNTPGTYNDSPVDQVMIPLCVLLKKLAVIPDALVKIKERLVPPNIDRRKNLTEGSNLTAALIRAMTSITLSQTRDILCELLLTCFDGNVERFVHYVGYANAAGYLFTKGITTPQAAGVASTNCNSGKRNIDGIPENVDFMTGRFHEEKPDPFAGMTDEEKEREAERLFVLFDRLNKTGIMNRNAYRLNKDIRKDSLNLSNRLQSIKHDAQFVEYVAEKFPSLPVIPNERAGCWYVPPQFRYQGQSVYFKSTDGHFGKWDISIKRLNLHLLPVLQERKGIIIVDATKKGKKFPDALLKTIPIWIAVMNSIVHGPEHAFADCRFKSVPSLISNSEAQQINDQLTYLIEKFRNFNVDAENMIYPFLQDLKPLRPIFVHPSSTIFSNCGDRPLWNASDISTLDFTPIILVSASFSCNSDESPIFPVLNSFQYVQGAADDSELWCPGLKHEQYWKIFDIIGGNVSETFLKELLAQQLSKDNLQNHEDESTTPYDWIIDYRLAIGSRKAADPRYVWDDFDLVVNCGAPKFEYDTHRQKQVFHFDIHEGKKGQKQLYESFDPFLKCIFDGVKEKKRILIHCMQGIDRSVAMAMCLLLRYPNLDPDAAMNKVTKIDVLNTLLFIQRKRPKANPSRSFMKKIDLYFIN